MTISDSTTSATLASALVDVAAAVGRAPSPEAVYQLVVDAAVAVVDGCDHASVMLLRDGRSTTVAQSDDVARAVEDLERATGEGPCLDVLLDEACAHDADLAHNPTWPRLAERCLAETPVRSTLAFRSVDEGDKCGALNLFADRPGAFTERSSDEAAVLAAFCSVAMASARQRDRGAELTADLHHSRQIGKAVGILMATHHISDTQALSLLETTAVQLGRKLHEVMPPVDQTG